MCVSVCVCVCVIRTYVYAYICIFMHMPPHVLLEVLKHLSIAIRHRAACPPRGTLDPKP